MSDDRIEYPTVSFEFSVQCVSCSHIQSEGVCLSLSFEEACCESGSIGCAEITHDIDFVCDKCGESECDVVWPEEALYKCACTRSLWILARRGIADVGLQCNKCGAPFTPLPAEDKPHIVWFENVQYSQDDSTDGDVVAICPDAPEEIRDVLVKKYHAVDGKIGMDSYKILGKFGRVDVHPEVP